MKRTPRRILLALLLVCVYILWHPEPAKTELVLDAAWAVRPDSAQPGPANGVDAAGARPGATGDVGATGESRSGTGPERTAQAASPGGMTDPRLIPSRVGTTFAYVTTDGRLSYRGRSAYRVAMDHRAFVNHARVPAQLVVQDTGGGFVASIPLSGYPMFVGGRLFVVSDGGGSFSEWSRDGRRLWGVELPAPLTAVAASSTLTALGLAAGGPVVLADGGQPIELQSSSATIEPIVYSVSLSENPDRFAVLEGGLAGETVAAEGSGLAATVTLYDLGSGRGVPVVRRTIGRAGGAEPIVRLVDGGESLVYTTQSPDVQLVSLDAASGDDHTVPLEYPAREVLELSRPDLKAVLTVSSRRDPARGFARPAELVLASNTGIVPIRASWASDTADVAVRDDLVVMLLDDRILAMRVGVR